MDWKVERALKWGVVGGGVMGGGVGGTRLPHPLTYCNIKIIKLPWDVELQNVGEKSFVTMRALGFSNKISSFHPGGYEQKLNDDFDSEDEQDTDLERETTKTFQSFLCIKQAEVIEALECRNRDKTPRNIEMLVRLSIDTEVYQN
ncbi:hypothetical protein JTB14_025902 [Gonioctena quinquepunctata]|nr:hypothetical protein JTB14_025902 [Gonioctena quinquepunctata]